MAQTFDKYKKPILALLDRPWRREAASRNELVLARCTPGAAYAKAGREHIVAALANAASVIGVVTTGTI